MQERLVAANGVQLRAADDHPTGTFEGYAVVWDVLDSYGTQFAPGLFTAGGLDGDPYPLLNMHMREQVIGTFTAREDDRGLWISGGWDPTPEGQAARARARSGSAPALSVGFRPMMVDPNNESRFTQAELVEVSQITLRMQAVPGAGFAGVRGLPAGHPGDADADAQAGAGAVAAALLALAGARVRRPGR